MDHPTEARPSASTPNAPIPDRRLVRRIAFFAGVVLLIVAVKAGWIGFLTELLIGPGAAHDVQQVLDSLVAPGVLLAFLVALYLELFQQRQVQQELLELSTRVAREVERLEEIGKRDLLAHEPPATLLKTSLQRAYADSNIDVDALVSAIIGKHNAIHRQFEVEYQLTDSPTSPNQTHFRLIIRTTRSLAGASDLFLAFVVDEALLPFMYATRRFAHDFWWVRTPSALSWIVTELENDRGGNVIHQGRQEPLHFKQIDPHEYANHIPEGAPVLQQSAPDRFALLRAQLPQSGELIVCTEISYDLPVSNGRFNWITDRPTHLRKLTIDWSRLSWRDDVDFWVKPFFVGGDFPTQFPTPDRRIVVQTNRWILSGEGAVVVWSPTPWPALATGTSKSLNAGTA